MKTKELAKPTLYCDYAHGLIKAQFKKIAKLETAVLKDDDPEPLHEMRVAMRRLRTALKIFASALQLSSAMNPKQVAKTARVLGEVRDLDVLAAELQNQYAPHLPDPEQKKLQRVLKSMQRRRTKAFAQLEKTLKGDRYLTLKQAFQTWLEQPTYTVLAQLPITQIAPDLLSPLISQLLLHPAWLVHATFQEGQLVIHDSSTSSDVEKILDRQAEILHDLRKQIKGVRYQAEFFAPLFATEYSDQIHDFKTIQEILGQLQDSAVLCDFLATELDNDLQTELPTLLQQIQQKRLELWQSWQPIQQRYLNSEFRLQLRQQVLKPQSNPAS